MTDKIAFIFPGQGSQFVGMGKDLYETYPKAKYVFDKAVEVLDFDIKNICFSASAEDLKKTTNTQPAIVTMSISVLETLRNELNIAPVYSAGHSLGEYCAMYSAGVLSLENTFKLIKRRSELMSEVKGGSMSAVLNAPDEVIDNVLKSASQVGYISIANYNSPNQIVLTGDDIAVKKANELFLENGAKRVVSLAVSGAFHSKYMESASAKFREFVENIEINDANFPVITNVDAEETVSAGEFRVKMPKQISSSVYWTQTIQKMVKNGVRTFIEIGPGKVLAGLNKKINQDIITYNIYDTDSLNNVINILKSNL